MATVGLVGVGLIGRAWANVFARAGWETRIWDPDKAALADAPKAIAQALHDVAHYGLAKDSAAAAKRRARGERSMATTLCPAEGALWGPS